MRAVIQCATSGEVRVGGRLVGRLALGDAAGPRAADPEAERGAVARQGLVVLLGVARGDGPEQVATVARKIAELRILDGEASAMEVGAPILLISQFTLYGIRARAGAPRGRMPHPGTRPNPWSMRSSRICARGACTSRPASLAR